MIIIKENITNKKTIYAENDKEFIDSLFKPVNDPDATNNRGTLALFNKIQQRKHEILFYIDEKSGYFRRCDGLWGQFSTLDNGKKFFQWTTAEIIQK